MKEHKKEEVSKGNSVGKEDKEEGKRRNVLLVKSGL